MHDGKTVLNGQVVMDKEQMTEEIQIIGANLQTPALSHLPA